MCAIYQCSIFGSMCHSANKKSDSSGPGIREHLYCWNKLLFFIRKEDGFCFVKSDFGKSSSLSSSSLGLCSQLRPVNETFRCYLVWNHQRKQTQMATFHFYLFFAYTFPLFFHIYSKGYFHNHNLVYLLSWEMHSYLLDVQILLLSNHYKTKKIMGSYLQMKLTVMKIMVIKKVY